MTLVPGAGAVSFGQPKSAAVLGQTLDLRIPLSLAGGEALAADCFAVEVIHGESKLEPQVIRYALEPGEGSSGMQLRVRTLVPINEPVVQVNVGAGCPPSFFRRYTWFPDPPSTRHAGPGQVLPTVGASAGGAAVSSGAQAAASTAMTVPAPAPDSTTPPSRRERSAAPAERPPVAAKAAAKPASKSPAPARPRPGAGEPPVARADRSAKPAKPANTPAPRTARLMLDPLPPQLRMDTGEPLFMGAAALAAAASGVGDGAPATSPADRARMLALEQSLKQHQRDAQTQRQDTERLRAELDAARGGQQWLTWLLALLGLCLAAIAWMAWRLRNARQPQWWEDAVPAAGEPPVPGAGARPDADAAGADAVAMASGTDAAHALERESEEPLEQRVQATLPPDDVEWQPAPPPPVRSFDWQPPTLPGSLMAAEGERRAQTAEELLDLEQQADFFVALGQEDAAADLLMNHLRDTDGRSPLPYMQLLELHRRRDDRPAYDRIRQHFTERFGSEPPAWDEPADAGRGLEDHPETMQRLAELWPAPAGAMAELEALMFRRDAGAEPLDLPAYRDLLTLYALARDRQQHGVDEEGPVDLLLPLEPAGGAATAAPAATSPQAGARAPMSYDFVLSDVEGAAKAH